jgi:hypothetical protein
MGVSGQGHAPAALYPRGKDPDTHWIGGWVGPRAGLDAGARRKILYPWIKTAKITVFRDVAQCSLVEVHRRFRGAYCLHHQGDRPDQTTRRNIPEDSHLHTRRRENLKSHLIKKVYISCRYTINVGY